MKASGKRYPERMQQRGTAWFGRSGPGTRADYMTGLLEVLAESVARRMQITRSRSPNADFKKILILTDVWSLSVRTTPGIKFD